MICKNCGKEIDSADRFCRACGASVESEVEVKIETEKQKGYKDDVESTLGRFDGKYMLMAGVLLGVLILIAMVVKFNYAKENQGKGAETVAVTEAETIENFRC